MLGTNKQPQFMTRGDNESFTCAGDIYDSNGAKVGEKPFVEGDSVTLTVRQRPGQGEALITKTVTEFVDGIAIFSFVPADTSELAFGTYSYDVEVTYQDIGVKTIVTPSDFVIGTEDTF